MAIESTQSQQNLQKIRTIQIGSLPSAPSIKRNVDYASTLNSSPPLYDYKVILARYSNSSFLATKKDKWREWRKFLLNGGIACIFHFDSTIQRHDINLTGTHLPNLLSLKGEKIKWIRGTKIYSILKDFEIAKWAATVDLREEKGITVLARNGGNEAVAFEVVLGQGRILFLPGFELKKLKKLVPSLIKALKLQTTQISSAKKIPEWIDSIILPIEPQIKDEIDLATIKLDKVQQAKHILFEEGKQLSNACAEILSDLLSNEDFRIEWKEEMGLHDIEINNEHLALIIEVRASNGTIDVDFARQLMDHIQTVKVGQKKVKGILIGNPHRQQDPTSRRTSFSRECVALAKRNSYCLMTTIQLLALFNHVNLGDMKIREFVDIITSCEGELQVKPTFIVREN